MSASRSSSTEQASEQTPKQEVQQEKPYGAKNEKTPNRFYPPSRTLFVGNLPFFCTEADIRATFEAIAPIESIRFGSTSSFLVIPFNIS